MYRPTIAAIIVAVTSANATAQVRTREDARGQALEVSSLADEQTRKTCFATSFVGTIRQRRFADDDLTLVGVVLEARDGTRSFINIEIPKDLDRAQASLVHKGLQQLTRNGRRVKGNAYACGAAGRVEFLDTISAN